MKVHRKVIISIISFLMVLLLILIVILMFEVKKTDAIVLSDDLTCHYREIVYVDRFIKSIDGTLLDKYLVDTSSVGKRQIEVQYRNRYGFVEQKRFDILVVDEVAPVISINEPLKVSLGEISNLMDVIFCADDYDDNISCKISGEYNLNEVGDYNLSIEASDKSGNKTKKDFTLHVVLDKEDKKEDSNFVDFKDIYHRYKADNTELGVDISKWQGDVDFVSLANAGVSFVMLKIGGQSEIGGEILIDPFFQKNIDEAILNHLSVGVYFYSHAKSEGEARKQARWVLNRLSNYNIELPVAFDWENWDKYSKYGIGFRTLNNIASSFILEIERNNYKGMLYSSKYYLENIWYSERYTNWLAYYSNHNDYDGKYIMWQISNHGRVDGVNGDVDIDILRKSN